MQNGLSECRLRINADQNGNIRKRKKRKCITLQGLEQKRKTQKGKMLIEEEYEKRADGEQQQHRLLKLIIIRTAKD